MSMNAQTTAEVIRLPVQLRMVFPETGKNPSGGITTENPSHGKAMEAIPRLKTDGGLALDRLLEDGTLDARQHAAARAYGTLRRRYDRSGGPFRSWRDRSGLSDEAWQSVKRDHARLLRAAGAERFVLDRLCLDDDAPLSSEVERVRAALGRVAKSDRRT